MSQYVEGPLKTDTAAGALGAHLRVKTPGALALAGASDVSLGTMEFAVFAAGDATIRLRNASGTRKMVANDAITKGNVCYAAANGRVAAAGTVVEGIAFETSANAGDIIEVMPLVHVDLVAAAGITLPTVTFNGATTVNKVVVPTNLADALSIEDSAGDIVVITTTTGSQLVTWTTPNTFNGLVNLPGNAGNAPGSGIATHAAVFKTSVERFGSIIKTSILIDLTGLNSGNADGDIIGKADAANCHIGRITAAVNGTIVAGRVSCLETPAGGEPDIDLYSATEATGVEDAAIADLTETALLAAAADWTGVLAPKGLTANPAANQYLYLVASGGATNDTYTAGIMLIELWGTA
jgi:hypothetical protein